MKRGFTLIEITVVSGIIILLAGIVLANYRAGEKQFALRRSAHKLAQDLRTAQEMAMSSRKFGGTFPAGGYGIHFQEGSGAYILFADSNDNDEYDETGEEKVQELSLEKGIKISGLSPASPLDITFFPPDPFITINRTADNKSAGISLSFTDGQSITININIAGLIDID